jgi:transposase
MNTDPKVSRPRLVAVNRRQMVMRAMDVERLIEEDHPARAIWELVGRLDLSRYYAEIAAVEGRAGRDHTDPQVLISLWLYAYSRGISSAREVARRCEYEPAFQWLCALDLISHRTLSGFRSGHQAALNDLFVQVLGMLSAEGLVTLERVTLDGTKIKANAGGNTFRRQETLEAHLQLAREQVRLMEKQAGEEEQMAKRQVAARGTAAPEPFGGRGARGGALAAREKGRSRQFCGARLDHRPGSPRDEEWRGRHGSQLQRTTGDRQRAGVGGECGGHHRRRRSPSTRAGAGPL